MPRYTVEQDGVIIFDEEIDSTSSKEFPAELRDRPAEGEGARTLRIDDDIVGTQMSEAEEAAS